MLCSSLWDETLRIKVDRTKTPTFDARIRVMALGTCYVSNDFNSEKSPRSSRVRIALRSG